METRQSPELMMAQVRHFAGLPDAIRQEIAAAAVPRSYDTNQMVYLEGEPARALFILEKGWVKAVRISPEGREQGISFFQPGEVFGDVAVFTGRPYPATVIALEPVRVWAIERSKVEELLKKHNELALAVIERLAERVLYFVQLVEDLSLRSVESRLANTLLKNVEKRGELWIVPRRKWTNFDEMAVRLGTVRDVLGRTLRSLEEAGLLRVERQRIIVLDLAGLAERGRVG